MSVASRLVESGHYASQQIKQIASQLEQEWKAFAAALDERSTLLDMSSVFHQKAEKVSAWYHRPPPARSPVFTRQSPGGRWGPEVHGCAQPAVQPQARCSTSLSLTFLICKVERKVRT